MSAALGVAEPVLFQAPTLIDHPLTPFAARAHRAFMRKGVEMGIVPKQAVALEAAHLSAACRGAGPAILGQQVALVLLICVPVLTVTVIRVSEAATTVACDHAIIVAIVVGDGRADQAKCHGTGNPFGDVVAVGAGRSGGHTRYCEGCGQNGCDKGAVRHVISFRSTCFCGPVGIRMPRRVMSRHWVRIAKTGNNARLLLDISPVLALFRRGDIE